MRHVAPRPRRKFINILKTNLTKHSPWQSDSTSLDQCIRLLKNPKFQCCIYKSLSIYLVLSNMDAFNVTHVALWSISTLSSHLYKGHPSGFFALVFRTLISIHLSFFFPLITIIKSTPSIMQPCTYHTFHTLHYMFRPQTAIIGCLLCRNL
jgi:hypothetical protein